MKLDQIIGGETFRDGSLVIACPDAQTAAELTTHLYQRESSEVLHVEHYPVTNDETGELEYIALTVRQLTFERGLGWFSSDLRSAPDIDLR